MYLLFNEVILIQDKAKRKDGDGIVYHEDMQGSSRLWVEWHDHEPSFFGPDKPFPRYGTIYEDANKNWCVVPDTWNWSDVQRAKEAFF